MTGQSFAGRHRVGQAALLVVVAWLALVGGVLGPLSGKLTDVQKNSNSSFLPPHAESTRALAVLETFTGKDVVGTVVLYEREAGLTTRDRARAVEDLTQIRRAGWLTGSPSPPVPSADGKALQLYLPLNGRDVDVFVKNVGRLRALLVRPGRPAGLRTYVTGLGGLQADLLGVFRSIDSSLLLVTGGIVAVILLVVYRSPVLWVLPLVCAGTAYTAATGVIYLLARAGAVTVNGQSQGIVTVLVFGAGTDYALLLIARYREELHRYERTWDAMRAALRGAVPAILASALTVVLGLLCLLASELASNRGLGPVSAIGIVCAALTMVVLLPAMLLAVGRGVFWPAAPQVDGLDPVQRGPWSRVSALVGRRRAATAIGTGVLLLLLALGATHLKASGVPQSESITGSAPSVVGQQHLARHFAAGVGTPVDVVGPAPDAQAILGVVTSQPGVAGAALLSSDGGFTGAARVVQEHVLVEAVLSSPSDSSGAAAVVSSLRRRLDAVSHDALVGGFTAIDNDIQQSSRRDRGVIIPSVLGVILLVLGLLLRSIVAAVLLVATVVLSFFATLGVCAFAFQDVFGFPGSDSAFPLFAFVFLVALGIDYNIFLMTRVREETKLAGTRAGTLKALTVTGGVITSAGVVLAATFGALGVLPLVFLAELGFAVAFGVLLDTLVVRSLLVPALTLLIGDTIWWPGALAHRGRRR